MSAVIRKPAGAVGRSIRKVDGLAKSTGQTRYADDLQFPRMLHAKLRILLSVEVMIVFASWNSVDLDAALCQLCGQS